MKQTVIVFVLGMLSGVIAHMCWQSLQEPPTGRRYEIVTKVVTDTVRYLCPVARDSMVTRYVYSRLPVLAEPDTMARAASADEVLDSDSAEVVIPIEQKVYEDSTYKAWVSGYMARLDSIRIYLQSTTTTIREKEAKPPSRWGIGVTAGYGYGKNGFTPWVGVGISYQIIRF